MKVIYRNTLFFIALFQLFGAFSQEKPLDMKIIPPSPDAAALGKYGEVPVGLYTGVPNISIPLYEIKTGGITLPISISYHASGIKVEDMASRVGLGWSLSAGGVITRSVRGRFDDKWDIGSYFNNLDKIYNGFEDNFEEKVFYNKVAEGKWDAQPDAYYYNFGNYSGRVIFDEKATPHEGPYRNFRFDKYLKTGLNANKDWEIVTPDGTRYIFREEDAETSISVTKSWQGECGDCEEIIDSDEYISTWNISKIIAPNGADEISFYYETYSERIETSRHEEENGNFSGNVNTCIPKVQKIMTYTEVVTAVRVLTKIHWPSGSVLFSHSSREDSPKGIKVDSVSVYDKSMNLVKRNTLNFSYFLTNVSGNLSEENLAKCRRLRLDSLSEVNKDEKKRPHVFHYNKTELPPRGELFGVENTEWMSQDHWGYYNGANNNTLISFEPYEIINFQHKKANRDPHHHYMKAGVLEKIEYPTGGHTTFEYEPHDYYTTTEKIKKAQIDVLGDGLLQKPNLCISQFVEDEDPIKPKINCKQFILPYNQIVNVYYYYGHPENDPLPGFSSLALHGPLKNGKYENKHLFSGALNKPYNVEEVLEAGAYLLVAETNIPDLLAKVIINYRDFVSLNRTVGGLRLKKMIDHDGVSDENDVVKKYKYRNPLLPERSSGLLYSKPVYRYILNKMIPCNNKYSTYPWTYFWATGANELGRSQNSHIGYPFVTVEYGENAENGSSKHKFTALSGGSSTFPFPPFAYTDYDVAGSLLRKQDYNSNGDLVKEQINQYNFNAHITKQYRAKGLKIGYELYDIAYVDEDDHKYAVAPFYDYSYLHYLKSTRERTYSQENPGDYTETVKEYFHDNPEHAQLTRSVTKNADGSETLSKMSYPADYPEGNGNQAADAITKLKEKHLHNTVIEQRVWEKPTEESDSVLTSASLTEYNDFGAGLVLPQKVLQVKNTDPLTDFVPSKIENGLFSYDNRYNERLIYNKYDTKGNILEHFRPSEEPTAYIWDYNKTLPSAKTVNASTDQIAFTSFETTEGGGWTFSPEDITEGGKTGKKALSGTATKNNLPEGEYTVSLWAKGGNISVNGEEKTAGNDWEFLEWKITPNGKVTVASNNALIDELRLHPAAAQMTSYTYRPLVGMTSAADQTGTPIFYEYDDLQRLRFIKDQSKHILKEYNYHYFVEKCALDKGFLPSDQHPFVDETVSFQAENVCNEGGTVTYHWNFDDGNTAEGSESFVTHAFNAPGNYWVELTVKNDSENYDPVQSSILIKVTEPPLPVVTLSGPSAALPNTLQTFTAFVESGVPPYSYVWERKLSLQDPWAELPEKGDEVEVLSGEEGFYIIKCTVTDSKNNSDSDGKTVAITVCDGEGQKFIDGECVNGVKEYTQSSPWGNNQWLCKYHYYFSKDNSYSEEYEEISNEECLVL